MSRALVPFAVAALAAALLPACTQVVTITYPGNNPVRYPWRSCGMGCEAAFTELQTTPDASGQACQDLETHAAHIEGGDPMVSAALLYDSALLLIVRNKEAEAADRFARAEALDPDPEYKRLEQQYRDAAARHAPAQ